MHPGLVVLLNGEKLEGSLLAPCLGENWGNERKTGLMSGLAFPAKQAYKRQLHLLGRLLFSLVRRRVGCGFKLQISAMSGRFSSGPVLSLGQRTLISVLHLAPGLQTVP